MLNERLLAARPMALKWQCPLELSFYLMGLASLVYGIELLIDAWESGPAWIAAGLLFWYTRKKWWATVPGFVSGCIIGFVTVRSRQPHAILAATLDFGAVGAMLNSMSVGFFYPGCMALVSAFAIGWLVSLIR